MNEVQECLLDFKDDGMHVCAISLASTFSVQGVLKKSAFEDYAPIGKIGVDELKSLIAIFKKLGSEIDISVEGNLMTVEGKNKTLIFTLMDEKYIEKPKLPENLVHSTTVNIDAKIIRDSINDASMNSDVTLKFITVDNGLKITNDGKYKFKRYIDTEGTKGGVEVAFGEPIKSIFDNIDDKNVELKLESDYPLLANIKNDVYDITFLVAPKLDEE